VNVFHLKASLSLLPLQWGLREIAGFYWENGCDTSEIAGFVGLSIDGWLRREQVDGVNLNGLKCGLNFLKRKGGGKKGCVS
jgi:hypothetical protein